MKFAESAFQSEPEVLDHFKCRELYTTLILVLIRRHLIKIGRWDENSKVPGDLKDLPEDIYADLQRVSELAYKRKTSSWCLLMMILLQRDSITLV